MTSFGEQENPLKNLINEMELFSDKHTSQKFTYHFEGNRLTHLRTMKLHIKKFSGSGAKVKDYTSLPTELSYNNTFKEKLHKSVQTLSLTNTFIAQNKFLSCFNHTPYTEPIFIWHKNLLC